MVSADVDDVAQAPTYLYDLVDVTRQALQVIGDRIYPELVDIFLKKELSDFR